MHEELQTSRKQGSDALAKVRSCHAAATEHAKAVSTLFRSPYFSICLSGLQHSAAGEKFSYNEALTPIFSILSQA